MFGAGTIGKRHIDVIRSRQDCCLVGIADSDPAAAELARRVGVPHDPSFRTLIERERPDAAVIATPNGLHVPQALECVRSGIHLLVEKPVADTFEAAAQLVRAARTAGVVVLVGHHRRFHPRVRVARELMAQGRIGRLIGVNAMWAALKPEDYFAAAWRRQPGGGPVMINLIHELDLLRFLCGEIVEVYARASHAVRGFEVEDTAAVTLTFANGALGTVLLSDSAASPWNFEMATGESWMVAYSGQNTMRFVGSAGALDFPNLTLWRHADPAKCDWRHPLAAQAVRTGDIDIYAEQMRHFCAAMRGEEPPITSAEDGARSLFATLGVLRAAREGVPVRLDPQFS